MDSAGMRRLLRPMLGVELALALPVLVLPLLSLFSLVSWPAHVTGDWAIFYRQASLHLARGESPYGVLGTNPLHDVELRVYNPVWLFALLLPVAALPPAASDVVLRVLAFGVYWHAARRLSDDWRLRLAFMYSAPVATSLVEGQIDFLVLGALWLPASSGIWLSAVKPQTGIGLAAHQAVELWRTGRRRLFFATAAAMAAALVLSVAFLGYGIEPALRARDFAWNRALPSPWLRAGAALAVLALAYRERDAFRRKLWVGAVSPVVSAYAAIFSWVMLLCPLLRHPPAFAAAWLATWLLALGLLW